VAIQGDPNPYRRRFGGWWLALLALIVLAILALVVYGTGGKKKSGNHGATTAAVVGTTGEVGAAPAGGRAGGPGTLAVGSQDLLALAHGGGSLSGAAGTGAVKAKAVQVEQVVDAKGFWVGSGAIARVFVRITGTNPRVRSGDHVSFTGALERNAGAPATYGLRASEGAALLRRQGYHVKVQASRLTVVE
jgi:hypothetical protein